MICHLLQLKYPFEKVDLQKRIRSEYLRFASGAEPNYISEIVVVDASKPFDDVVVECFNIVKNWIN